MSDTFDHEMDAWESREWELDPDWEEDGDGPLPFSRSPYRAPRCRTCKAPISIVRNERMKWELRTLDGQPHRCTVATEEDFPPVA